jgi:hypothetical protein
VRFQHLPQAVAILCLLVATTGNKTASAQFETSITAGTWTAFLPEYRDTTAAGVDQSGIGGRVQLHSFYHFEPTRTMAEVRASLAGADMSTEYMTDVLGGTNSASLRGSVIYNDVFVGLRDKFDLTDWGLGRITLGAGFSHMHFDQSFNLEAVGPTTTSLSESLQSSYVGGEIVGAMTRQFFGRNVYLDGAVGMYDLDADYVARGSSTTAAVTTPLPDADATFSDTAYTLRLTLKTDFRFAGVDFRPTTGIQYISSMPGTPGATTELTDDDAFILNGGWEFFF